MRGLYTNQKRQIEHFGPMLCFVRFLVLVLSLAVLVLVLEAI
jgi:hypothetical protein